MISMTEIATLAGGCFWCTEAVFLAVRGVQHVESGYTGGHLPNPTYDQVCSERTGHAEAVRVTFDPSVITYGDVLRIFFATHDPTQLNRQGNDVGSQYRSAVFYHSPEQERTARDVIRELSDAGVWDATIVTEVSAAGPFYVAEAYHQNYYARNPRQGYCLAVVAPKVSKLRKQFASYLKPA